MLRENAGQTVVLTVVSPDGASREVPVTLRETSQIDENHGALGIAGIQNGLDGGSTTNDLPTAIAAGASETVRWMGLILGGLGSLVGSVAADPTAPPPVSGPIGIATQIGDVFFQAGPIWTLFVAGILSANLAVVNILPFPPLDGGRMLMITLKSIFGTRISVRAEQMTYVVGFVFLFAFIIWVSGFDILRSLGGAPPPATLADALPSALAVECRYRPAAQTVTVDVGGVPVGSAHPVVVQSMTNTDTADADGTAIQVARLAHAGSELVRVTVNTEVAAAAVPEMVRKVRGLGVDVPIIGDFHYNGHQLLVEYPETAALLAKYRINPGNVGAKRHDEHFATIVRVAIDNDKPVRIGVNWGSLDQAVLTELMDANARLAEPRDARDVMIEAMLQSALRSAELAEATGLGHDRIIISAKVSGVRDLVDVYRELAARCDYPLHLGLTEAGMGDRGIVASTAGLAILLNEGIGDTIRVSLTPEPGAPREREVEVAQQVLQSMGLRSFLPQVSACPGLRTDDLDVLPGDGPADPGLPQGPDAGVEGDTPGRRGPAGRGDGLRRQRSGRVEARRHRHQPAGHVRGAGRPGVHRWTAGPDAPRRWPGGGVHRHPRGLRRAQVPGSRRTSGGPADRRRPLGRRRVRHGVLQPAEAVLVAGDQLGGIARSISSIALAPSFQASATTPTRIPSRPSSVRAVGDSWMHATQSP